LNGGEFSIDEGRGIEGEVWFMDHKRGEGGKKEKTSSVCVGDATYFGGDGVM